MITFSLFAGGLSLIVAITKIANSVSKKNLILFGTFFSMSVFLFKGALLLSNEWAEYSHFFSIEIGFMFLIGPLLYFYFNSLIDDPAFESDRIYLHLIPALVFFSLWIADTIRILWNGESFSDANPGNRYESRYELVYHVSALVPAAYILSLMKKYFLVFTGNFAKRIWLVHLIVIFFLGICSIVLSALIDLRGIFGTERVYEPLSEALLLNFGVIVLYAFFVSQKYPATFNLIADTIRKIQYDKSTLGGLDLRSIDRKLERLILDQKIHLDPKLSLSVLSKKLGITPHQGSEFLNAKLDMNFSTFVNKHRIEEAKRLLESFPEIGILEISWKAGFNSLSTFNATFKKETGLSPREYRLRNKRDR
ncbi:helix-turn-helix domain-containing protein [Leptospira ellisii]|uniref:Helix-turn-helix domain-containing protein n=2 Tax=Leptospira ellisii TaxID=2023197 RepID=A0AAE4QLV9_9LEPT|nr:helix-turn-helix domain-containing protein [Leptospira ellisii]MDV6234960.1 helix-turn-helix domain-containing protein [Leptospira ellisii]